MCKNKGIVGSKGACQPMVSWRGNMNRIILACSIVLSGVAAHATVIDFDDVASGTLIDNEYAAFATFSSSGGAFNEAVSFGGSNILGTRNALGQLTFVEDTFIDFTNAVNGLEFDAIEPNFAGVDATFQIFHSGGSSFESLTGLGGPGNKHVDLSGYVNVTRLEITDILDDVSKENGIGWDNFSFNVVPEPVSMLALGAGIAGLVARRRRH